MPCCKSVWARFWVAAANQGGPARFYIGCTSSPLFQARAARHAPQASRTWRFPLNASKPVNGLAVLNRPLWARLRNTNAFPIKAGLSSQFTLPSQQFPGNSSVNFASNRISRLQGAHHPAQKSIQSQPLRKNSSSNVAVEVSLRPIENIRPACFMFVVKGKNQADMGFVSCLNKAE